MKTKLIDAIRETIIDLETGRKVYDWSNSNSCNCGLLAINLGIVFNGGVGGLFYPNHYPPYSRGAYCSKTGLPISHVIRGLLDFGLSEDDITELENLTSETILKEAEMPLIFADDFGLKVNRNRNDKKSVLAYFRAWLRILEREEPAKEYIYCYAQRSEKTAVFEREYENSNN